MDEGTGPMSDRYLDANNYAEKPLDEQSPEEIRENIEQTRAEMSNTIDELQYRLDPERLKSEAKQAARDATVGRAEDMMDMAQQRTKEAGNSLLDTVKSNPVPAALIGVGIGWMIMSRRDQGSDYDYDRSRTSSTRYYPTSGSTGYYPSTGVPTTYYPSSTESTSGTGSQLQERAQHMAGQAQEQAGQMVDQAQHQVEQYTGQAQQMASQAQGSITRFVHDNPLAAAAIALGVGFAVGFAVPETDKEDQLLGEAHARAMDRAESVADQMIDKAADSNVVSKKIDEMTDKAAEKAKDAAHQAMNE